MILIWIAIAILIILAYVYIKISHNFHLVRSLFIIVILVLLLFSIISVFSANDIDLTSTTGIINGVSLYFNWLGETIVGLWQTSESTFSSVGHAIKINESDYTKYNPAQKLN